MGRPVLTLDDQYLIFCICEDINKQIRLEYKQLLEDKINYKLCTLSQKKCKN
jgi:hypothetical protein